MYTCIHVHNDELNTALLENLLYVAASCCVASTTFHAVYLRKVMGANMVRYFLAEVTRSLRMRHHLEGIYSSGSAWTLRYIVSAIDSACLPQR